MRLLNKMLAFALIASMGLAGCSSQETETKETSTTTTTTEQTTESTTGTKELKDIKVGISIYQFADNFMTQYRTELEKYLISLGVQKQNIIIQDGKNDQAEQTNQIKNFITDGVDVMILNLVQSSSAPTVTDMAHEAGIPVVYINREPDAAEESRWETDGIKATYVGADARQSGTFQGEMIAELENKGDVNGDGVVSYIMIQGDPENVDAQYRTEFSVKAVEDAGMKVKELLIQRGDWDQAKGQQITQDALTQFGKEVEVIFSNNDSMALGALQAIESQGRKVGEDIYIVGVDALAEAVENVLNEKMTGTVFNDFISQSHTAGDLAIKFVLGEEVKNVNTVDYVKVTADKAKEILELVK